MPSPSNPVQKDAKLQSREVKVPVMTERRQSQPHAPLKPVLKKTPLKKVESSSSEEEETDEEEEEYTDEEVEEEEEMDEEMAEMERLLEEARKEASKKARDDRMKKELAEKAKAEKMMVKLKPVLKKTPTIEEMPKEKPKSFLETPKLRKVVKSTEEILETKSAKPKLEMPTLKKVVKKDSPVVVKAEPDWKSETVLQPVKNGMSRIESLNHLHVLHLISLSRFGHMSISITTTKENTLSNFRFPVIFHFPPEIRHGDQNENLLSWRS